MDSSDNFRRGVQKCPCQCHWNWDWLRGAFGETKISPSDVDQLFHIERYGHILFIETKHIDEILPQGQRLLLEALSRKRGQQCIVLYGERDAPAFIDVCDQGEWKMKKQPTDCADIKKRIGRWFDRANKKH